jgi:polysaccharide export outer membrane protein
MSFKVNSTLMLLFLFVLTINAQDKNYSLGSNLLDRTYNQSGYFDFSDPTTVNIRVSVWGWVRYPGKYTVPIYTTPVDLLSLAGGPTDAADLEDLRIYKESEDSTQNMIKFSYNDVLYEKHLSTRYRKVPKLEAGDILVVPGEPRVYFIQSIGLWLQIFSVATSIAILLYTIFKK